MRSRYDYCTACGCRLKDEELGRCFDCKLFASIVKKKDEEPEGVWEGVYEVQPPPKLDEVKPDKN